MPRTRKNKKYTVIIDGKTVKNIKAKTYEGACYKAFKKLGIEKRPVIKTEDNVNHKIIPKNKDILEVRTTIRYSRSCDGTVCKKQ